MKNYGRVLCLTGILTVVLAGSCLAYDAPATPLPGAVDTANAENANVPGLHFQQTVTLSVDLQAQLDEAKQMVIRGKDYQMAIAKLTQVIKLNPQITEAFYWRAVAHNQMDEYREADEDYESALMLEPTNAGLYYYRGLNWQQKFENENPQGCYGWCHDLGEANKFFQKALKYAPNYLDAEIGLAQSDFDSRDYEDALARYNKLLVLMPNNPVLQIRKEDCQKVLDERAKAAAERKLRDSINN